MPGRKGVATGRLRRAHQTTEAQSLPDRLSQVIELAGSAYLAYRLGLMDEKRDLVKTLTSNRSVNQKLPMFVLASPFNLVAKRFENHSGRPTQQTGLDVQAVWDNLLPRLVACMPAA
jgi:hypothetical protein